MNKQKLHILILEDNPEDAELMVNELRKNDFNFDWELVENKKEFVEAIEKKPDIILADYKLPTFDGLSAIKIQQKTAPDIPIIIVSGSIGEELAVECLKAGATGYVLKEKLSRLSLVIERSLKEAAERREFKKANEALKESEKKYHAIFEATGTATLIVEENTKIINANKECEDVTGYAVTELIGKSWTKFVYKDDLQMMLSRHKDRRKDSTSVPDKYEVRLIDAKGNIRNTILSIGMVPNSRRSTVSLVDITELKHADDLLKERIKELQCLYSITEIFGSEHIALEKLFQKAVNLLSQACQFPEITCARITFDGNVYKTKNFKKTKWILSKNIYIKDEVVGKIDVCYLKEKPGEYDELFCKKERKLLKEVVKKIEGYIEHVRAEEKIKKSEEKYRDMTELLPEIIYECDAYGNITFVNKAGFEKFGYTQDDFNKGVNAMQFITPAERERAGENVKEVLNGTEKGKFEYTALRKDNSEFPAVSYSSPIISNNKVVGLRGIVVDVTESKLVEDALRESDDKYHLLVENAPNVLWKTNEKGHTVFISSNIKEVFGFTPEDIYTDSDKWFGRIHHDDLHKVETAFQELFSKNKKFNVEYRIKRKDGKWIWLNDISSVVHEEKGERYAYGVFTDITERKLAEKSLHIANEDLRNLTIYMDTKIEEERKTLSRDIHDGLGQLFTTMIFSLSSLTKGNEINEAFVREINDIIAMTKEGIELTRTICRNLRPSLLDNLGLKEAIIEYSTNFSKLTNILCHCKFQPENFIIDKKLSLNLYRIVTELFTNVARHSKADLILLDFSLFENELIMRLEDNGIGIKTEQIFNSRSLGLIGIRERLRSWNGNLLIERNKPKGTKVIIRIPGKQFSVTNKE